MKANELMVGDYVQLGEFSMPNYKRVIAINSKYDSVTLDDGEAYYCCNIKPIPLTENLLKANGFVYQKRNTKKVKGYYVFVENPDTPNINVISVMPGRVRISYHTKNGEWIKGINLPLHYVHEYQDALRICKLNELANKFKVKITWKY